MKKRFYISMAIVSLGLAALACQAVTGSPNAPAAPTNALVENTAIPGATDVTVPTQTEEPVSNSDSGVLYEDDFSSSNRNTWGTGTDAESSVEYLDDGLNMQLFKENYIVWSSPTDQKYSNVHMEVTALNNGTDSSTAFGFMCNQQYPITDSRYFFAITPGGEYAIGKAQLALDDVILTNNGEWGKSDLIAKDASSYHLAADCGNDELALYVDGQKIASASDTTYTDGGVTLFVWSGNDLGKVNVTFDDFRLTKLP
jgi:hypothetical protein